MDSGFWSNVSVLEFAEPTFNIEAAITATM